MLLPTPADPAALRAFSLFLALLLGTVSVIVLWLSGGLAGVPFGAVGAAVLLIALTGMLRPYVVWPVYRAWNWLARHVVLWGARYVTAVCFGTVLLASSWSAPSRRFRTEADGASMWNSRSTQPVEGYHSLAHDLTSVPGETWLYPLRSWIRSSGQRHAYALLPFLWLLHALDSGEPQRRTSERYIYTLY